ncbi:MAG: Spx/MgsR family RNA polymerase-binding regulatory protein [Bacteroidales bacterium]|nr:Spx/MgsR family RNA polymerase-binding regulatory protein [Bacteroidales bacterium]
MHTPHIIYHPRCGTCKKALQWLQAQGVAYTQQDLTIQAPTRQELTEWFHRSGLPINKLFNTSGQQYRALNVKALISTATADELLDLLASDSMLIKRPILVTAKGVAFGFKTDSFEKLLG